MNKIIIAVMALTVCFSGIAFGEDKEESKEEKFKKLLENDSSLKRKIEETAKRMEKEDTKLRRAEAEHAIKIVRLKEELIETYEDAIKKYTKKGDLRSANFLLSVVDSIKKGETVEKPTKENNPYVGSWIKSDTNTILILNDDKTIVTTNAKKPEFNKGVWNIKDDILTLIFGRNIIRVKMTNNNTLSGDWNLKRK